MSRSALRVKNPDATGQRDGGAPTTRQRLLAQFESALRAKRIDVDRLAPGLTDDEIDEIIEPWGLEMPDEARAWWRWRNPAPSDSPVPLLPRRMMLNLNNAIWSHVYDVKSGRMEYADPQGGVQPVDNEPVLFVQCVASGNEPAPVYLQHAPDAPSELALASFGELVLMWIGYIERGIYAARPEGGWQELQNYPPDVLELGVQ